MDEARTSDYLVLGGGLAGSVIASRLAAACPDASITVLEAGADESSNPLCGAPLACFDAPHSALNWAYTTAPQTHLDGRRCYATAGKALGGSTAINYGTWTRGARADYDAWATIMDGDARWGYEGLLEHFRNTESHFDHRQAGDVHGLRGPIHTASITSSSPKRRYGLRDSVHDAWTQSGVSKIEDANSGNPVGFSEVVENWRDGKRQIASVAYGLQDHDNVTVKTNQLVKRVVIGTRDGNVKVASGAETTDGGIYHAKREVIVSCGAYRSPQLLLLSGIGPSSELSRHGIVQHVDLPVGRNFHDHPSLTQYWRLSQPERGLSIGTPLWADPAFQLGLPRDWIAMTPISSPESLSAAQRDDEHTGAVDVDAPAQVDWARAVTRSQARAHIETLIVYAPADAAIQSVDAPVDGTHIATVTVGLLPTSRGTISLSSDNPADMPVIDPNFYATSADRVMLREGVRQTMRVVTSMKNPDGSAVVLGETTPGGLPALGSGSSDGEIDERVRKCSQTFYHPGGGCVLGDVVDGECRVKGVEGLRIADASIMPTPLSAHYMVAVYAIAEQAAVMIAKSC